MSQHNNSQHRDSLTSVPVIGLRREMVGVKVEKNQGYTISNGVLLAVDVMTLKEEHIHYGGEGNLDIVLFSDAVVDIIPGCLASSFSQENLLKYVQSAGDYSPLEEKKDDITITLQIQLHNLKMLSEGILDNVPARSLSLISLQSLEQEQIYLRNISLLRELDILDCGLTEIPQAIFKDLPLLVALKISFNYINEIKADTFTPLKHLNTLELRGNSTCSINEKAFQGLESLTVLDISGNLIETLPDGVFSHSPNLNILSIQQNRLQNLPVKAFEGLSSLQYLIVSLNSISVLDSEIFTCLSSLENLDAGDNQISEIKQNEAFEVHSLKILNLTRNSFEFLHANAFKCFVELNELCLDECAIKNIESGAFVGMRNLEKLYLNGNNFEGILKDAFSGLQQLKILSLNNCNLKDSLIEEGCFDDLGKLLDLNISQNCVESIYANFFGGLKCLEHLNLSENNISTLQNNCFDGLSSLLSLNLFGNKIESLRSGYFVGLSALNLIDLSQNSVSTIESRCFAVMPELKNLNLNRNKIKSLESKQVKKGNEALKSIFDGISALEHIDLSENEIDALSPEFSFSSMTNLKTLDIRSNKISLVEGIFPHLSELRNLDLSQNKISRVPQSFFYRLKSLQALIINSNEIEYLPLYIFSELPELTTINLSNNKIRFISSKVFKNVSTNVVLNLSGNNLWHISDDSGLTGVESLDVSNNKLIVLPKDIRQINILNVEGNDLIVLPSGVSKEISGYEPDEDSKHMIDVIEELYQRHTQSFQEMTVQLSVIKKQFSTIIGKFKFVDNSLKSKLIRLLRLLDENFTPKLALGWIVEFIHTMNFLYSIDASEVLKMKEAALSFLDKAHVYLVHQETFRSVDDIFKLQELHFTGCLNPSALRWYMFSLTNQSTEILLKDNETSSFHHILHCHHLLTRVELTNKLEFDFNCDICTQPIIEYTHRCVICNFDICPTCLQSSHLRSVNRSPNQEMINRFSFSFQQTISFLGESGLSESQALVKFLDSASYHVRPHDLQSLAIGNKRLDADVIIRVLLNYLKQTPAPANDAIVFYVAMAKVTSSTANADFEQNGRKLISTVHQILSDLPPTLGPLLMLQAPPGGVSKDRLFDTIRIEGVRQICENARMASVVDSLFETKTLRPSSTDTKIDTSFLKNGYIAAFNYLNFEHPTFFSPLMSTSIRFWCTLTSLILSFNIALNPSSDIFAFFVLITVGGSSVVEEIEELLDNPMNHFKSFWNWIDFGIASSMMAALITRILYLSSGNSTSFWIYKVFVIISCIFLCFRLLSSFRLSNMMGPLVHIFVRMFVDVARYLLLSLIIVIGYTVAMTTLLADYLDEIGSGYYDSFRVSFLTLTYSILGNYSTDMFNNITSTEVYVTVHVIYILFLITNVIMLVNFLIALMSATFNSIFEDSQNEFRYLKIQLIYDCYSSDAKLPPPFTLITEVINQIINLIAEINSFLRRNKNPSKGWYCRHCLHHNIESEKKFTIRDAAAELLSTFSNIQDKPYNERQMLILFNNQQAACTKCYNPYSPSKLRDRYRSRISRTIWGVVISPIYIPLAAIALVAGLFSCIIYFFIGFFTALFQRRTEPNAELPTDPATEHELRPSGGFPSSVEISTLNDQPKADSDASQLDIVVHQSRASRAESLLNDVESPVQEENKEELLQSSLPRYTGAENEENFRDAASVIRLNDDVTYYAENDPYLISLSCFYWHLEKRVDELILKWENSENFDEQRLRALWLEARLPAEQLELSEMQESLQSYIDLKLESFWKKVEEKLGCIQNDSSEILVTLKSFKDIANAKSN